MGEPSFAHNVGDTDALKAPLPEQTTGIPEEG